MNPFHYTEPVTVEDLLDRDAETEFLLRNAEQGTKVRVVAPRRYGKTSLLHRVLHEARAKDWNCIYVNFFGVTNLSEIAKRIEIAYSDELDGRLARWWAALRNSYHPTFKVGGGPLPVGVDVALNAQAERPLLERLAIPRKLFKDHGKRTLVVFDEFQDVMTARDRADAVIRSEIEHHGKAASYLFAGSKVGMMRDLFSDRRRAFYGQARPLDLGPLAPEDVAEYVGNRFERTQRDIGDALDPLLTLCQGHPQRSMQLAHYVWELTEPGTVATRETWLSAFETARAESQYEFAQTLTSLPRNQLRALIAVAANTTPLYSALTDLGASGGGSITATVTALIDAGVIMKDEHTRTGHRIVDPLFATWINDGPRD